MFEKLRPDPTFHPSPRLAMEAEREHIAYTALLSPDASRPDALAVVDVDPSSKTYGSVLHRLDMPHRGDEFHHFGWNACSSALSPMSGHAFLQRRYLVMPGHPLVAHLHRRHPARPDAADDRESHRARRGACARPATRARTPCTAGPRASTSARSGGGGADGTQGPPGIFIMDCENFEILGKWEIDRGPQKLHYDFWWNLPRDYMVSSEWGLPPQFENGIVAEDLLANRYGHRCISGTCASRRHVQTHRPRRQPPDGARGAPGARPDARVRFPRRGRRHDQPRRLDLDLVPRRRQVPREEDRHHPARAGRRVAAAALLKGFGAVPPLISDIDLSLDDRFLYVACWGTGELRQYDVTDPMKPELAGSVRIGGIARRTKHPSGRPSAAARR